MGKDKKKKKAMRFDPLARPAVASGSNVRSGEDDEIAEPKQLSAHQQRHLERKRLQAEALALRQAKGKVSKADKLAWQREQRELGKTLQKSKAALRAASARFGEAMAVAEADAQPAAQVQPAFAGFNLPVPAGAAGSSASWFAGMGS